MRLSVPLLLGMATSAWADPESVEPPPVTKRDPLADPAGVGPAPAKPPWNTRDLMPAPEKKDKKAKRARKPTAVLRFAPRTPAGKERSFQPLVCAIDGVFAVGKACGEAMPARTKLRTPTGEIEVARSTEPFHDE